MNQKKLFLVDGASDNLLSNLDSRDIALWLIDLPKECPQLETLISFLALLWRLVLSEVSDKRLISSIKDRAPATIWLDEGASCRSSIAIRRASLFPSAVCPSTCSMDVREAPPRNLKIG